MTRQRASLSSLIRFQRPTQVKATESKRANSRLFTLNLGRMRAAIILSAIALAGCGTDVASQCQQLTTAIAQAQPIQAETVSQRKARAKQRANLVNVVGRIDSDRLLSMAMSHCRRSQADTCTKLREAMLQDIDTAHAVAVASIPVGKQARIKAAQSAAQAANILGQLSLSDPQLQAQRDRLVQLYTDISAVGFEGVSLIDDSSQLQPALHIATYEKLISTHVDLIKQAQNQQRSVGLYCSMP